MKATYTKERDALMRKYHALSRKLNMERDDRLNMLAAYGVESSVDLTTAQLKDLCDKMNAALNPDVKKFDTWRKRAMASIGGWLKQTGQESSAVKIKAIACRITGHDSYNAIPVDRLRNVYYLFLNKQKDFKAVEQLTAEELEALTYMN